MRCLFAILSLLMLGSFSALAAPDETAFAFFSAGEYEQAVEQASAAGGAENLAFAARSLNALAYLQTENKLGRRFAKRALEYAEDAMEADDTLVEAHLQAAIALAQRGARMAALRAFFLGVADRARDELDLALSKEPNNAWALSSSGAWHLEVARRVGEGRFGSDPQLGFEQFLAARAMDPQNLLIAYECALRLIAHENQDWREEGLSALDAVLTGAPADAFETSIQLRARDLSAAIAEGRDAERAFIDAHP